MILVFEYYTSGYEYSGTDYSTFEAESMEAAEQALLEVIEYNDELNRKRREICDRMRDDLAPINKLLLKAKTSEKRDEYSKQWLVANEKYREEEEALGKMKQFCGSLLHSKPDTEGECENYKILTLEQFIEATKFPMIS